MSAPPNDFAAAVARGRWDIDYFSEFFLGITGHSGQSRFWSAGLRRTPDRWRAAYLTICISAGNRAGKTLGLAIYIFHSTFYKMGTMPPEPGASDKRVMDWMKSPYDWWHFGIQGEVAELVHVELQRILSGTHPAQKGRGCPLVDMLGPQVADYSTKERGDYPWVRLHPSLGGGQIHFRSTNEKALGSLGKEMNGVSWDECAFSSDFDFIVDEVLHMRRMGTGGQLVLISTSTEGLTAFTDKWNEGDPDAPDRKTDSMSLRISTRENIGFGLDPFTFERLIEGMPEYLIPQNIDGFAIESRSAFFGSQAVDACFVEDLPPDDIAKPNHRYAQGVDPALTYDSSWAITLDMTDGRNVTGVRVRRKTGRQTTLSVASMVTEGHRAFNTNKTVCTTALDATGFGGKAFYDILSGLHPFRAIEFGGTRSKKLKLLLNLKDAIEKGRVKFPKHGIWLVLRRQLLGYRLDDKKIEQDAVMALAVAWDVVRRNPTRPDETAQFGYFTDASERVSSGPFTGRRVSASRLTVTTMGEG